MVNNKNDDTFFKEKYHLEIWLCYKFMCEFMFSVSFTEKCLNSKKKSYKINIVKFFNQSQSVWEQFSWNLYTKKKDHS